MNWKLAEWLDAVQAERSVQKSFGVTAEIQQVDHFQNQKNFELACELKKGKNTLLNDDMEGCDIRQINDDTMKTIIPWNGEISYFDPTQIQNMGKKIIFKIYIKLQNSVSKNIPKIKQKIFIEPADYLEALSYYIFKLKQTSANKSYEDFFEKKLQDSRLKKWMKVHQSRKDLKLIHELIHPDYRSTIHMRTQQAHAILASQRPLSFVWGPPGTGKTWTIGMIMAQAMRQKQKVLVLANSNLVVDQATLSVNQAYTWQTQKTAKHGSILRTRMPQLASLYQHKHLLAWDQTQKAQKEIVQKIHTQLKELREKLQKVTHQDQKEKLIQTYQQVQDQLESLNEEYKAKIKELMIQAQVVLSTLNQYHWVGALHDPDLEYDLIIFEEASMIPVAHALRVMLNFPKARIVVAGDFRQLSPIVIGYNSPVKHWFQTCLFELFGCLKRRELEQLLDQHLIHLLDEQLRMPSALGEAISQTFYDGKLKSLRKKSDHQWIKHWPQQSILLVDQLPSIAFTSKFMKNSNPYEVEAAFYLAKDAHKAKKTVLVITPFKNQQRLLKQRFAQDQSLASITVGTVHKIQGQEADVVIYSPVNPGSYFINRSEQAARINNVALSRAKQHVILLGSRSKLRKNFYLSAFVNSAHLWNPTWTQGEAS